MVFKKFLSKAKEIDVLSSIPDGIMLVGSSGTIEWLNDVTPIFFRMNNKELLKAEINKLIEGGLDLVRQAANSSKSVVGKVKSELGKDSYLEITARIIDDFFVVSLRDVTQNYKTVTSLLVEHESSKKVNKDKNGLLVKLSNELKSPLQSVIGFSQAMIDGLGGNMSEKQSKYIKIINKNSNEILYLIDKIIELSKTESNLYDYDFQIFDVTNSVQSVLKNVESTVKSKNLALNIDTDELIKKTIYSDEETFKIIFQNIIETSLNYTDVGSVNIKISHPDLDIVSQVGIDLPENSNDKSYLLLTVLDTGVGINEKELEQIFEPYTQLEKSNKKNIVRSLALASAKNLVKYLRGAIWVESEPMKGSSYNVILPIEKTL